MHSNFVHLLDGIFKLKDANESHHVQQILKHYDEIQGRKNVEKVQLLMEQLSEAQTSHGGADILGQFNLHSSKTPLTLRAKVLPEPKLMFGGDRPLATRIDNGSWNMRGTIFSK